MKKLLRLLRLIPNVLEINYTPPGKGIITALSRGVNGYTLYAFTARKLHNILKKKKLILIPCKEAEADFTIRLMKKVRGTRGRYGNDAYHICELTGKTIKHFEAVEFCTRRLWAEGIIPWKNRTVHYRVKK